MRKIPSTMATQHPDNAQKPFWNSRAFITTSEELKECLICFSTLGIDEYNWDWEGKFVDEAVIDRLLHRYYDYFAQNPIGVDKFLTFRIPNPRVEKQYRLARAFMVIVTSSQLAQSLGFNSPPLFEIILPLTESAEEIIEVQEAFRELVGMKHKLLKMEDSIQNIEIIPLLEKVENIVNIAKILKKYINLHKFKFGTKPKYIRPYLARSDPALNSGLIPTVLAIKIALSQLEKLKAEEEISFYPMIGTGTLPFRGGVAPDRIDETLNEYQGIRTLILQSAFRYDYPQKLVQKSIQTIAKVLPHQKSKIIDKHQEEILLRAIPQFEKPYQNSVEQIANLINRMSKFVARRRERMLHVGLFGYSRGVGKVRLPRAIPFTASLYSLGIPPEFIGSGRGLKIAQKHGFLEAIENSFINLKKNFIFAGYFLNKDNLLRLAKRHSFWYEIIDDIKYLENILHLELGPVSDKHHQHKKITDKILTKIESAENLSYLITHSGYLRNSLG